MNDDDDNNSPIFGTDSSANLVDVRFVVAIHRSIPFACCPWFAAVVGRDGVSIVFDYGFGEAKMDDDYERLVALWRRCRPMGER
jgi:hypothetical protein